MTGFLKIGKKSLYLFNEQGKTVYVSAICLLDFWIHESRQRQGWGGKLFQYMLEQENLLPQEVAYDRPSPKLLNFLTKYYGKLNTHRVKGVKHFYFGTHKQIIIIKSHCMRDRSTSSNFFIMLIYKCCCF